MRNFLPPDPSKHKTHTLWSLIVAVMSLILGVLVYAGWRSVDPVFVRWAAPTGLDASFYVVRNILKEYQYLLPGRISDSLPSAFWAFSYTLFISVIWRPKNKKAVFGIVGAALALVIGWELCEAYGLIPGTFCWYDILFGTVGIAGGSYYYLKTLNF